MKQTKRLFAVLLAVVMLLGVVPVMNVGDIGIKAKAASLDLSWPCESCWAVFTLYYYKTGSQHGTRWGYQHAIDISGSGNILAADSGTVVTSEYSSTNGFGNYIVIQHKNGDKTLYGHLASRAVSVNQTVSKGQYIGVMGSTGNSSGTHLHFEWSGGDPWKEVFWNKYADQIYYQQNVRSNNATYNDDQFVVDVIDTYYKKSGEYYYRNSTPVPPYGGSNIPGTPTLTVSSENVSNKNVTFTWNKVSNVDHYDLRVYNYGDYNVGAPYGEFGIAGSRTSSSIRLSKGKYAAYITAVSSSGGEAPSNWPVFIVSDPPGTPTLTINNIFVTDNIDNGGVEFKWTKAANTDHYDLRVYNHGDYNVGAPYYEFGISASKTSTKMKLPIGKYAAYISAVAESGAGAPSEWITVFSVLEPDVDANFPTNIKTYKMWTGDTSTHGYDCSNYNQAYLTDNELKIVKVYNNNWVKAEATVSGTTKSVYIPLGGIVGTPCTVTTKYCKASTPVYRRYNNTTVYHTLTKDTAVKVIGTYQDTRTQICYTVSGQSYIGWVLNDTLCAHSSTGHSYTSKVTTAATCTTAGVRTYTCSCGASYTETIAALGHSYGAWTKLNDTQHQRVCSRDSSHVEKANHTWNNGTVTKAATCSATGTKTYTCTVCNATKTETINALGHSYGAWTKLNDTQHQRVCSRNSTHVEKANHSWNNGTVTKAATCSATGTKTYTCTVCNATKTETIAINSSNHVNTKNVAATASTCTVKGYTAGVYCNDCKRYISGHEAQPLAAHTLTTINKRDASCTAEGYTGDQYCTVCKQTISTGTTIGKKAHTLTTINHRDATYDAEGYTGDQYCTVCKQTISTGTTIPKLEKPTEPTQPQQQGDVCRWCGQNHGGIFGWLVRIFHNIFAAIFGARY